MNRINYAPGCRIVVRDAEWIVKQVEKTRGKGYCLEVTGISPIVKDKTAYFLTDQEGPIEVLEPANTELVYDPSNNYENSRLYIETLLRETPPEGSSVALGEQGAMDPVPYQLDPAVMALKAPRCRILIADAVGLGKTVEAGILLTELIARGRGKRILVLAVKSMLTQFQKELWSRFSIPLVRLDSAGITRIKNKIPTNYNPFYYFDKTIISIDTLKKNLTYRAWLEKSYWDIIVIDEAHNVARRSKRSLRSQLADNVAENCDSLIMLSATPHDGKKESFASLMNMLNPTAITDVETYTKEHIKGMFIRRFKKDVKDQVPDAFPPRESRCVKVPATARDEALFQALSHLTYAERQVYGKTGRLLFKTILEKGLLSSPQACFTTVKNRLKRLEKAAGFASNLSEIQELKEFAGLLQKEDKDSFGKYNHLVTLLRDKEFGWNPKDSTDRLVIFTERIETLRFLRENLLVDLKLKEKAVAELHGTLSDREVQTIVEDFGKERSPLRLLIASDMAAEGINLHYLCHRMIHFDIPWSLMVFQQRNGRIDRYGQTKPPLITYLLTDYQGEKGRGDMRILELLIAKDKQVQENIGDPGEFTGLYDVTDEEARTGRAMETGEFPGEADDSFLANLLNSSRNASEEDGPGPGAPLASLYESDYAFYLHCLRRLEERHGFQLDLNPDDEVLVITRPPAFKSRERFLPREVWPKESRYFLTTKRAAIIEEINRCRKEESAWPAYHLLWDRHPLAEWLRDEVMTLFGRHQAPVLPVTGLKEGEFLLLIYGLIPNQRGQTVVRKWFGLKYKGKGFVKELSLEEVLEITGLENPELPNTGAPTGKIPGKGVLKEAAGRAQEVMKTARELFNRYADPQLRQHYYELEERKQVVFKQLELQFDQRKDRSSPLAKDWHRRKSDRITEDFNNYVEWIGKHMRTEEMAYIRFTALFCSPGGEK